METCEDSNTIVLSVTELMDNKDYVLVKFKEYSEGKIVSTFEKGIKDKNGDIEKFIPIKKIM